MKQMIDFEIYRKRFEDKLQRNGECLEFIGCINRLGYGRFNNPWEKSAHRFSWFLHNGQVPKNIMVLHSCDNRKCCEITHLWLGNQTDNMRDMTNKGRHYSRSGQESHCAKINEETAKEIIQQLEQGIFAIVVAKTLNIGSGIVHSIRNNRTWKHLPRSPFLLQNGRIIGERNNLSKLTEIQVQEIRRLLKEKEKPKDIAAKFNVNEKSIYNILNKQTWAYLPE